MSDFLCLIGMEAVLKGDERLKMPSHQYLTFQEYEGAAAALHILAPILLLEFARYSDSESIRNKIARNFIARADFTVRSVFQLWEASDYTNCWILHRGLIDRLFHINDILQNDSFQAFDDWSFKQLYEAAERLRSNPFIGGQVDELVQKATDEQQKRYGRLVANPPIWRRPKAKEVAKRMDLDFLYNYGYDYASRFVHPMATDGEDDFGAMIKLEQRSELAEKGIVVLSNSVLIATMIFQDALNASSLSWMAVVFDAIDGIRGFLRDAAPEHHVPLSQIALICSDKKPLAQPEIVGQ
jgi:hypothetical protein